MNNHKRIYRKLHTIKSFDRRKAEWFFAIRGAQVVAVTEGMSLKTIRRLIDNMNMSKSSK